MTASAPHVFESAYYERLAELEQRHWWGLGMRALSTRVLDRVSSSRRSSSRSAPEVSGQPWRVFDAGCGTGLTLSWLSRYTPRPPVGLDYAADALRYCLGRGHRGLVQGTATALPIHSARFDVAISFDVMQHLPRPGGDRQMLAEVGRILSPGGWFLLRTNSRCGYKETHVDNYHRYTRDEVRALLAGAGFDVVLLTYANCIPGLLATLRQRWVGARQPDGDPGLFMVPKPPDSGMIVRIMYWCLLAEAWWVGRWGRSLPFGHSIVALARRPAGGQP